MEKNKEYTFRYTDADMLEIIKIVNKLGDPYKENQIIDLIFGGRTNENG